MPASTLFLKACYLILIFLAWTVFRFLIKLAKIRRMFFKLQKQGLVSQIPLRSNKKLDNRLI